MWLDDAREKKKANKQEAFFLFRVKRNCSVELCKHFGVGKGLKLNRKEGITAERTMLQTE
jgi:hypothetical protein